LEILDTSREWWKAKDSDGNFGIIPSNYVELLSKAKNQSPPPESSAPSIPSLEEFVQKSQENGASSHPTQYYEGYEETEPAQQEAIEIVPS